LTSEDEEDDEDDDEDGRSKGPPSDDPENDMVSKNYRQLDNLMRVRLTWKVKTAAVDLGVGIVAVPIPPSSMP